ncbi:BTAD domain-containing putative transcriptional regulator [Micromonospora rubida]|uniref:BTAD domain-containing putative transcriptional regulator n=1 Tax=Micromonospora rubida TaxID=2697657 RepID=A0ABW7SJ84_9ACTN
MAAHPSVPAGLTAAPGVPILHLLGGPFVTINGVRREVPEGSKRLLVFVALQRGAVKRQRVAGALWALGDETRALGNLRSALWRLRVAGVDLVASDKWSLRLRAGVAVDLRLVSDWAGRLIRDTHLVEDLGMPTWSDEALDLLPGWYDDWVLMERERVRQLVLHALEALSRRLVAAARCAEAVEAAMAAVTVEPLRESAQRALIEAHLAEGNWVEGRRAYQAYRELLRRELGVVPATDLAVRLGFDAPVGRRSPVARPASA